MMISADTNIFVHAANRDSPLCSNAVAFLAGQANNPDFVICEFVLVELYMCLRNESIFRSPLSAREAVGFCDRLRANPSWQVVDSAPEIRIDLWKHAATSTFPFRRIIDARLALTLKFHGVESFATANIRDFESFGFAKLWNPLSNSVS